MATTLNNNAKTQLIRILRSQGYATYARLVDKFDIYLTDDPKVVGYMIPDKAKIVLNQELNMDQVSTVIRHEILHEYLTHMIREQKWEKDNPNKKINHDIFNIAADYEISNRGYTEKDKKTARAIKLGDQILQGLVTEDQHPDWVDLTFEQMMDKLSDEYEKDMDDIMKQLQPLLDAIDKMNQQDMDDMQDQAQQQQQQAQQQQQDAQQQQSQAQQQQSQAQKEKDQASSKDQKQEAQSKMDAAKNAEEEAKEKEKQAKELGEQAEKAEEDLEKAKDKLDKAQGDDKEPFGDAKDQRDKADVARRVQEIKDLLNNIQERQNLLDETDKVVGKEKAKEIQEKELKRVVRGNHGLEGFKLNLQKFIKDQVSNFRGDTWSRPSKNYMGTDFIMPGKTSYAPTSIPSINVYWDVSASFDDPAKTEGARQAMAFLNKYVKEKKIKIHTYYFADRVSDDRNSAGQGTRGTPILMNIQQTKPTNVIVITDGDINDCSSTVTVPGAVWYLFYQSASDNLREHLLGKMQTKSYMVY